MSPKGVAVLTDRETFERMTGAIRGVDPTQQSLDQLLDRTSRIRVVASGLFRGKSMGQEILAETCDPEDVVKLRDVLRIVVRKGTFDRCACLGGPTIELYSEESLLATLGLQHGRAIRFYDWAFDAKLENGDALNDWLRNQGVHPDLLKLLLDNNYEGAFEMLPLGFRRLGPPALSAAEQRLRVADIKRDREGRVDDVLSLCESELAADPDLALAYAIRAHYHSARGEHAKCEENAIKAIDLGIRNPDLYFFRAVARDSQDRPEEALADCDSALAIDPYHAQSLNSRGLIRMKLGQPVEALADFSDCIRVAPGWLLPYMNRSSLHMSRGHHHAAIRDFDAVIAKGKNDPENEHFVTLAYWNRGQCHRALGKAVLCMADLKEAIRRDPKIEQGL